MEISTEIEKNIRRHVVKGVIDIGELREYLKDKIYSSEIDKKRDALWDLQKADFSEISSNDLLSFVEFVRGYWGKDGMSKAAIVVSQPLGHEMTRMYQILVEMKVPNRVEVFKDINEAEKWLGLG
ncbi:MAG: hypothetical protein IME95_05690 [Proteobacteria bacterium]|nr:hypothetical protein [Pseudomonadota bacterium]